MRPIACLRQSLLGMALMLAAAGADAHALIVVCYNWGCQTQQAVSYPDAWLRRVLQPLRQAKTPAEERAAVAEVVHQFYLRAAEQTPIGADEPGNVEDETVNGRMDCIDHSATTKNVLLYLQHRKLLRWHEVGPYAHRSLIVASHYSATLIETTSDGPVDDRMYTIDPWDVDRQALPPVQTVREWAGARFYTLETQHHTQNPPAALTR